MDYTTFCGICVSLFLITLLYQEYVAKEHRPRNFKTITIRVRPKQTLWEIACLYFDSNPYGYTNFAEYYQRLVAENKHLLNKSRFIQEGDRIYLKVKRS